jgi:hypothetical protein
MSAVIERFIICDECGEPYGVDNRQYTIRQHREGAKMEGWKHRNGRDICPECQKQD